MKHILFIVGCLVGLSTSLHAQNIIFQDTVTVQGYFYCYATNGVYKYYQPNGPHANDCYFVAEKDLQGKSLIEYLGAAFTKEGDTVKYLSAPVPQWLDAYRLADAATKAWRERVITVNPFLEGQVAIRFGHAKHRVYVTKGRIRWVRLRMLGKTACEAGFNRPPSLDCQNLEKLECSVYLPIESFTLERITQLH